ncbi:hypothetical protein Bcep18194_B2184 [Burkholderia lata]|uniref:Uncharacterized protein n=1 Tax=Burkholderia lata (strain ATCC 17760 / DSM 23089 / LMG 22485 / NCIMB 9086 / R18194 / 383) TaxID=482957 RepID=Q393S1_BURL3|nr:hypothetical protein Bcep18194_B2184 [Burkholderia lata]
MNRECLRMARPGSRIVNLPRATRVVARRRRVCAVHRVGATGPNRIAPESRQRIDAFGIAEHRQSRGSVHRPQQGGRREIVLSVDPLPRWINC